MHTFRHMESDVCIINPLLRLQGSDSVHSTKQAVISLNAPCDSRLSLILSKDWNTTLLRPGDNACAL